MKKIDQVFLIIASILILSIVFGTAVSFVSGKANPGDSLRKQDPTPTTIVDSSSDGIAVYSQIGTLRCSTADSPSIPIVVSPYFPYPSSDTAFYEELFKKNQKLRLLIIEYFESYTQIELLSIGEETIKKNLLELINAELVLGKVSELYFAEYIFLE